MAILLATGLLLAVSAPASAISPNWPRLDLESRFAGLEGAERYRALVAEGARLDRHALAELLSIALERRPADPVERELAADMLLTKLTQPVGEKDRNFQPAVWDGLLLPLAADPDWRVRLKAAELLRHLGTEKTMETHQKLRWDPVWPVRYAAIASLGALPLPGNAKILEAMLIRREEATNPDRVEAVKAVAALGDVPGLLTALGDPHLEVQLNAVWGLARMRTLPPEAVRALEAQRRETSSRELRDEIELLLERPSAPAPPPPPPPPPPGGKKP